MKKKADGVNVREKKPGLITPRMIAPCGMNCALCIGFLRDKKPCNGCLGDNEGKPEHCVVCKIKNCEEKSMLDGNRYCFRCEKFPCARLKRLDKRYRTKYKMSMIQNLERIKKSGIRSFVKSERQKWFCKNCGEIVCVHRENCINCGQPFKIDEVLNYE